MSSNSSPEPLAGAGTPDPLARRARMCLALIALDAHPRYRLVVAANRDEYHARPAAPAAWWDEGFLAGRDLKAGGTWLGVDRAPAAGRSSPTCASPSRHDPDAPSRGALVPRLLARRAAAARCAAARSSPRRGATTASI